VHTSTCSISNCCRKGTSAKASEVGNTGICRFDFIVDVTFVEDGADADFDDELDVDEGDDGGDIVDDSFVVEKSLLAVRRLVFELISFLCESVTPFTPVKKSLRGAVIFVVVAYEVGGLHLRENYIAKSFKGESHNQRRKKREERKKKKYE